MCGIAGIVDVGGDYKDKLSSIVKKMADSLSHRGPDGEGFFMEDGLALAHRRLAILDLSSAGQQPMGTISRDCWITYNGELYNYVEIKKELVSLGRKFSSQTDTEVILQAYEQWGEECLARFNGMWAFVIYDRKKNILFGSRDRFGVKPLYYYQNKDIFLFASEHKALFASSLVRAEINSKAAFAYLVMGQVEGEEESMFKNIFELQPSYSFTFDIHRSQLKKWKYYSLPPIHDGWENYDPISAAQKGKEIKVLLHEAIQIRLRSDVEIGACLSGGLDSSAIVAIANQLQHQTNAKLKVFTAVYKDLTIDESSWASQMVNFVGAEWHSTNPTVNALAENLEKLVYAQDIPFLSTSTFAQYCVMELVKAKGIKVTLDGQGGDEIFAGYDPHLISYWIELAKKGKLQLLLKEWHLGKNAMVNGTILKYNLIKFIVLKYAPPFLVNSIYANTMKAFFLNQTFWQENQAYLNQAPLNIYSSLNEQLHHHVSDTHLKLMLRTNERNAMHFSVEARQPFADDLPLIEYLFQQPSSYKIHDRETKHLLRFSLKDLIPETIRLRKDKMGFTTPESQWLYDLKNIFREYLTADLSPFFDGEKIMKNWDYYFTKPHPQLWRILNFAVWRKVFNL